MKPTPGLTDFFISPVTGKTYLPEGHVWLGDLQGHNTASPKIFLNNLPDLERGSIWLGVPGIHNPEGSADPDRPSVQNLNILQDEKGYPTLVSLTLANPQAPDAERYVQFSKAKPNEDYAYAQEPFVVLGQKTLGLTQAMKLPHAQNLADLLLKPGTQDPAPPPLILKISKDSSEANKNENWAKIELAKTNDDYVHGKEYFFVRGRTDHPSLENAQDLSELLSFIPSTTTPELNLKLLKLTRDTDPSKAKIAIATPGVDFLTLAQLEAAEIAAAESVAISVIGAVSGKSVNKYDLVDPNKPDEPENRKNRKEIESTLNLTSITDTSSIFKNPPDPSGHQPEDKKLSLFIGTKSGSFQDGGKAAWNTALGLNSMSDLFLTSTSNAQANVALGYRAMEICATTTASARYNTAIGVGSQLYSVGDRNVSIGNQTLQYSIGNDNVALGHSALQYGGRVKDSISIGSGALAQIGGGGSFTFSDFASLVYDPASFSSITKVAGVLQSITFPGEGNIAIGTNACGEMLRGDHNIAIGSGAMQYVGNTLSNSLGEGFIDGSVAIGYQALQGTELKKMFTVSDTSIAIGAYALWRYAPVIGSSGLFRDFNRPNLAIGYRALEFTTGGSSNIAIGFTALNRLNADVINPLHHNCRNIAIGDFALNDFTSASLSDGYADSITDAPSGFLTPLYYPYPNLAIGVDSLSHNTSGRGNLGIGDSTLLNNRSGDFNLAIGYYALKNINADIHATHYESSNMAIGAFALETFTSSRYYLPRRPNMAIGYMALKNNDTGRGNTAVGYKSLITVEGGREPYHWDPTDYPQGGDFNTALGYQSDVSLKDRVNATVIGAFSMAHQDDTLILGGSNPNEGVHYPNVGIGHSDPNYALHIGPTQKNAGATLALNETPGGWSPSLKGGAHVVFYSKNKKAYFYTDKERQIGTVVSLKGTDKQLNVQDDDGDLTLSLVKTDVTPQQYTNPILNIDAYGRILSASQGPTPGTVMSVAAGEGLTTNLEDPFKKMLPITTMGTISIADNPKLPGKEGVILPGGGARPTIGLAKGMLRYTEYTSI